MSRFDDILKAAHSGVAKPKKEAAVQITLRVPPSQKKKWQRLSLEKDLTFQDFVIEAVEGYWGDAFNEGD